MTTHDPTGHDRLAAANRIITGDDVDRADEPTDFEGEYHAYQRVLTELSDEIADAIDDTPEDEALDGPAWCEANDVPQTMFAHAVEQAGLRFAWGVSPLYPWKTDVNDRESEE